jgi:hypothetical protein
VSRTVCNTLPASQSVIATEDSTRCRRRYRRASRPPTRSSTMTSAAPLTGPAQPRSVGFPTEDVRGVFAWSSYGHPGISLMSLSCWEHIRPKWLSCRRGWHHLHTVAVASSSPAAPTTFKLLTPLTLNDNGAAFLFLKNRRSVHASVHRVLVRSIESSRVSPAREYS